MPGYFAIVPQGVEAVCARELTELGAAGIEPDTGGVHFEGDRTLLYRAHLHLRSSMRILELLREFAAVTPAMLYDQVRRIKWDRHLKLDQTFAVHCVISRKGQRGELTHSHFVELKVKDAIADELRKRLGARPDVDTRDPDVRIHVYLHAGRCRLSLDVTGESLHRRGYRTSAREAPMKESLAAAILDLAGWDTSTPLIDPMCGSGTFPIEAALKALNIAPGLRREKFAFMALQDFEPDLWSQLRAEARDARRDQTLAPIVGYDIHPDAVRLSGSNARSLGVEAHVRFGRQSIDDLEPVGDRPGVVVINPPYGKRQGKDDELRDLYTRIGDRLKQCMKGWKAYIFTGNLQLAKFVGLRTSRRIPLFNGPLECRLLEYQLY